MKMVLSQPSDDNAAGTLGGVTFSSLAGG